MVKLSRLNSYLLVGFVILLTGCTTGPRVMMPTPNVYVETERNVYANLAAPLKTNEVPIFYITDRTPEQDDEGKLRYGYGRSGSLAFGSTVVDLGVDITWDELVAASRTQSRLKPVQLELREVTELVRGPNTPLPYSLQNGKIVHEPKLLAQRKAAAGALRNKLVKQLALTPRKEVFIYVHGYNNTFDDAAFVMAEFWHFLGRIGVPIIYTWPAGYPGLFGYTYDRESSEFTVYHLREVLDLIASFPEVEKIHLIAHSRGTDVAIAAVRELTLLARGAGIDPKEKYKIHNLVLAAPDLDVQVATQRIAGDMLVFSVNRFTVYTSPEDEAIGVAKMLFQSPRGRIGTLGLDRDETIKDRMEYDRRKHSRTNLAIVKFAGAVDSQLDSYGHSYFRIAPAVSSDLVLLLRDDLDPGTPGRPLEPIGPTLWRIPPAYPGKVTSD